MVTEENLVQAQSVLKEQLNEKLAKILNEKFEQYAPTIFESKGAKPDFLDLDGDGNTKESMKKAAHDAEGENAEDVETDEEQSEEEEEDGSEDEDSEETDDESEEDEEEDER
jgi:hypothetical protein